MTEIMNSPINIGTLEVKNRVAMTAMGVNLSALGGGVSDDIIAFYEARAQGGVGLIISELTRIVDGAGIGEPCQLAARSPADVPDLQRLVDAVHKYDTKLFIQLHHPGRLSTPSVTGSKPAAPSILPDDPPDFFHELSTEECGMLVQSFAAAALYAQMAGADGVELHGAHGYLINAFLSPALNKRKDRYGGSFDNRMRFAVEIIESIRALCGKRFPVSVRINGRESIPGGATPEEVQKVAQTLEKAGVDAINVSTFPHGCIEPGTYRQGWKKEMVAAIKKAVDIPVIAVCNIKEPEVGEALLAEGICDLIGVARGHLADPEWCNKAFTGRGGEIQLCIGCLACFSEISKLRRIKCAVNPTTGREREFAQLRKDGKGKTVAVIGGGPAGIQAALMLKKRDYNPVIFEQKDCLGGTLNVANKAYGKDLIDRYIGSLTKQVEQAGIEVRFSVRATEEAVRRLDPVGVFVATGALPFAPNIPGIEGSQVCSAEAVLIGDISPGGKVVIIGSGMTGLEAAEVVINDCDLTLVEMEDVVGPGMYPALVEDLMDRIMPHDPLVMTSHRLEKIESEGIKLKNLIDDEETQLDADWVVLAMGTRPDQKTVEIFKKAFKNVRVVGDARVPGRILEGTQDAYGQAFVFDPS